MKTLLGFVLAILLSGNVFATTLCEKIFSDNITSNVISISQFRAKASQVESKSKDRKAQFLGLTTEQLKSHEDLTKIQDFLFDSTTNGPQFSFVAAYGQLKGRGIGTWPVTFHFTFDPGVYGSLIIKSDYTNHSVYTRLAKNASALLFPVILTPGTYSHGTGGDYTTQITESTVRSLTVEAFSHDRGNVKAVTFIKNSNGTLQEIRFLIKTSDIERSRSVLLEVRFLIEGVNPDIKPF